MSLFSKITQYTLLAFCPALVWAAPVDNLMLSLKAIKTFEAHFDQVITDEKGQQVTRSEGILTIQKPGRFYWKSDVPDQILVVADGSTIWTYDMELEQIVKHNQAQTLGNSPAGLLAGNGTHLNTDYDTLLAKSAFCGKGIDTCYKLIPRDKEGQFKEVFIGFNAQTLAMIKIRDILDQRIVTQFTQIKTNGPINSKLFVFVPPEGVDVIQGNS